MNNPVWTPSQKQIDRSQMTKFMKYVNLSRHLSLKNYDEASGAWKNSLFLTVNPKGDLGGEYPDPQTLKNKIEKVRNFLQQNY